MCEPFTLALLSTAGSLAATGIGAMQQQRAQDSQARANQYWREYQDRQRNAENLRQDELRQKAEAARSQTVENMTPEAQKNAQTAEESRLTDLYTSQPAVNQADVIGALLSGQQNGGQEFQTDIASRIAKASQDARKRIAALATINSYGGSFGGLQNRNAETLAQGDQGINLYNNMRQGSLSAYGAAKAVNPMQMPNQTDYASGVGSALAGIAGTAWGTVARNYGKV